MNPFEETKKLITTDWLEEIKSPYMVNRILSTSPDTFVAAVKINTAIQGMSRKDAPPLFNLIIPKNNYAPFFHYPTKEKKKNQKLLQKISEIFCVNHYHAKQIILIYKHHKINIAKILGLKNESNYGSLIKI